MGINKGKHYGITQSIFDLSLNFKFNEGISCNLNNLSNQGSKTFININGKYGTTSINNDFSCNLFPNTFTPYKNESIKRDTSLLDSSFNYSNNAPDISFQFKINSGTPKNCTSFLIKQSDKNVRFLPNGSPESVSFELLDIYLYNIFDTNGVFYQKMYINPKATWEESITHRYFLEDGVTTLPIDANRFITNQSGSSHTDRAYYRRGTIVQTPNADADGKRLYYINQTTQGYGSSTKPYMVCFGHQHEVSTYHIIICYKRRKTTSVAEFFLHLDFNCGNTDGTTDANRYESAPFVGYWAIGRYPASAGDGVGYYLNLDSVWHRDRTEDEASQQAFWGTGRWSDINIDTQPEVHSHQSHIQGGYNRVSCVCIKCDKRITSGSRAHIKVYTHDGNGVNGLTESAKLEFVDGFHYVLDSFNIGRYHGGEVPDSTDIYETIVCKDEVLSDEFEKSCAQSLLKKWLPYLGNV